MNQSKFFSPDKKNLCLSKPQFSKQKNEKKFEFLINHTNFYKLKLIRFVLFWQEKKCAKINTFKICE